jgi:hypothetical protein
MLLGVRSAACAGLPTYVRPQLPIDLNVGFPNNYTAKTEGERSPVDTIIQAAAQANVEWSHFDVCTYRNNMNKIILTPINRERWDMECCYQGSSGTLFLDIVPGQQATFKDADKFTYYGYHFEAVCTGKAWRRHDHVVLCSSAMLAPFCAHCIMGGVDVGVVWPRWHWV